MKKRAGRSRRANVNMICCTSVVLPAPGAPAMTLNENSGTPPPRTASSPGTPVGRRRMGTLSVMSWSPLDVAIETRRATPRAREGVVRLSPMNEANNSQATSSTATAALVATTGS